MQNNDLGTSQKVNIETELRWDSKITTWLVTLIFCYFVKFGKILPQSSSKRWMFLNRTVYKAAILTGWMTNRNWCHLT
jgi:hypothetical protein